MSTHHLKVWPPYFDAMLNGIKRFEYRPAEDAHYYDGGTWWDAFGNCHSHGEYDPRFDLVELVAVAVPVRELEQLRRAQAACEAIACGDNSGWDEWMEHRPEGVKP